MATYLVPGLVQHDCAADRYSCLVVEKVLECLLVVVAPVLQEWADMEEVVRKLLQSHRWEGWVRLPDEVFVIPVTAWRTIGDTKAGCWGDGTLTLALPGSRYALGTQAPPREG